MKNAWLSGASATPPARPGSPSIGYPTGGNVSTGTPPTNPGPYWFHMIMTELLAIITAAGITPDDANLAQLKAALDVLYAPHGSGVTSAFGRTGAVTAQSGDYSVGQITGAVALSDFTGVHQSLALPGRQDLPGGFFMQWTIATIDGPGSTSVTWPEAFPNACLGVLPAANGSFAPSTSPTATSHTTTGCVLDCASSSDTPTCFVFAIGH
jgi:hypothetical protein